MKPVFIGNFRSGTTLLANLLAFHPALAPWFETKGLCEPLRWLRVLMDPSCQDVEGALARPFKGEGFGRTTVLERLRADVRETADRLKGAIESGKGPHEHYPMGSDMIGYDLAFAEEALSTWSLAVERETPEEVAMATGALIQALGMAHAHFYGKPCWLNKTPELPRLAQELRMALGPCRMILMVRDGRGVVQSAVRRGWGTPEALSAWWKGMILESRAASKGHPEDYLEVRYEDLLAFPEETLTTILAFIGVGGSAEALLQRALSAGLSLSPKGEALVPLDPEVLRAIDPVFLDSLGYAV